MARTGLWFQFARGRAMVRNKSMSEARRLKKALERGSLVYGYAAVPLRDYERETVKNQIVNAVRRARDAHRDWRRYRKLWDAEQADNAEIEARFPSHRKNV